MIKAKAFWSCDNLLGVNMACSNAHEAELHKMKYIYKLGWKFFKDRLFGKERSLTFPDLNELGKSAQAILNSASHLWILHNTLSSPVESRFVYRQVGVFLVAWVAQACNEGNPAWIPGSGRSPEEGDGYPLQYSCLENSMDRGAWWAAVHGVTRSWTWLKWQHAAH